MLKLARRGSTVRIRYAPPLLLLRRFALYRLSIGCLLSLQFGHYIDMEKIFVKKGDSLEEKSKKLLSFISGERKNCKYCGSENIKKNGTRSISKGKYRISKYFCHDCRKSFSFDGRIPKEEKIEDAKKLFLSGFSMRAISKIFNVGSPTASRWLKGLLTEDDFKKHEESKNNLTAEEMQKILDDISPNTTKFYFQEK